MSKSIEGIAGGSGGISKAVFNPDITGKPFLAALDRLDVELFSHAVNVSRDQMHTHLDALSNYLDGDELKHLNNDPRFSKFLDVIERVDSDNRATYDSLIDIEIGSKVASSRIGIALSYVGKAVQGVLQLLQSSS
jgi:hypothetical protein